ncbi:MAG: murein biosynthesis integral membrane protein MurJ [Thermodesulfovibrionales bacterium]
MEEKHHIARAAGLMSVATFISRILGYLKDMILANFFGATGVADTFFVAFRIPNLLRELFAEGSMSSAFIPVLTEYHTKKGIEEAKRLVSVTFTFILTFLGVICIAGIIFAPIIVSLIAPGFLDNPSKFSLTVVLTRIMFPFLLFISFAALIMGSLNTRKVFFIPALAPAMLNIAIIVSVILLSSRMEQPIIAVAIGVVCGGLLQFAFQLPSFFKEGYSLKTDFNFRHQGLKKMSILILPATMGMAVAQINIFISTILGTYLPEGSITYLYYSMRLIQFPIGIFGVAMGMAVLPTLSEHVAKGEFNKLCDDLSFSMRLLFFITLPSMAGLIFLREPIVNILFQRGMFNYLATLGTAQALLFYSIGIWAVVGVRVITASFYSMQDTKTPVKIAISALLMNVILSIILMKPMKHSGLALANSLASSLNFTLLFLFLRRKIKGINTKMLIRSFVKTALASLIMGIIGGMLIRSDIWHFEGRILYKTFYLSGIIGLCLGIFFVLSLVLKNEEAFYVLNFFKQRFKKSEKE